MRRCAPTCSRAARCARRPRPPATPATRWPPWSGTCGPANWPCSLRRGHQAARPRRGPAPPAAGSSSCAVRACRCMRSAPGSARKASRWAAPRSAASCARRGSAGCRAAPRHRPARTPADSGRDTRLPAAAVIDFAAVPARAHTAIAGLLLAIPDPAALDLPALAAAAGYPGTSVISAVSWLLSLLALKLTATRRVSHVDDLLTDPAPALLAGLSILPKKTALTDYSYRLSHDHQQRLLAALDRQMIATGLATASEAIFDLDFHAVMHWGDDPALEKHYVPARSQRTRSGTDLLRPRHRHPQPGLRQRRHHQGHPAPRGHRLLRPLEGRVRSRPGDADHGPDGHH